MLQNSTRLKTGGVGRLCKSGVRYPRCVNLRCKRGLHCDRHWRRRVQEDTSEGVHSLPLHQFRLNARCHPIPNHQSNDPPTSTTKSRLFAAPQNSKQNSKHAQIITAFPRPQNSPANPANLFSSTHLILNHFPLRSLDSSFPPACRAHTPWPQSPPVRTLRHLSVSARHRPVHLGGRRSWLGLFLWRSRRGMIWMVGSYWSGSREI